LIEAGILTTDNGPLKVLGDGDLSVKLTVKAAAFTQGAKSKIEAAGGTCEVV
jgi:large subunit ribosomal protein L15